eukprot:s748_g16.t1
MNRFPASVLLQVAIKSRSQGDLLTEERLLRRCLARAQRHKMRSAESEAGRLARFYLALQGCQLGRFKAQRHGRERHRKAKRKEHVGTIEQ